MDLMAIRICVLVAVVSRFDLSRGPGSFSQKVNKTTEHHQGNVDPMTSHYIL